MWNPHSRFTLRIFFLGSTALCPLPPLPASPTPLTPPTFSLLSLHPTSLTPLVRPN
ncbi:unnamed protein product [Ectocarpus sp. 12 AP-2014]